MLVLQVQRADHYYQTPAMRSTAGAGGYSYSEGFTYENNGARGYFQQQTQYFDNGTDRGGYFERRFLERGYADGTRGGKSGGGVSGARKAIGGGGTNGSSSRAVSARSGGGTRNSNRGGGRAANAGQSVVTTTTKTKGGQIKVETKIK